MIAIGTTGSRPSSSPWRPRLPDHGRRASVHIVGIAIVFIIAWYVLYGRKR
jgi:hypothetical protein